MSGTYHNRGDGTFEEVSKKAGVDDPRRPLNLAADAIYTIVEGEGIHETKPLPLPSK